MFTGIYIDYITSKTSMSQFVLSKFIKVEIMPLLKQLEIIYLELTDEITIFHQKYASPKYVSDILLEVRL